MPYAGKVFPRREDPAILEDSNAGRSSVTFDSSTRNTRDTLKITSGRSTNTKEVVEKEGNSDIKGHKGRRDSTLER
jgi:hypothetical protein